jgi:hypothetical protein
MDRRTATKKMTLNAVYPADLGPGGRAKLASARMATAAKGQALLYNPSRRKGPSVKGL